MLMEVDKEVSRLRRINWGSVMKRRDFNRLVLGAGASSAFAKSSLAQMSAEELQTPAKAASPSITIKNSPRTYNQVNATAAVSLTASAPNRAQSAERGSAAGTIKLAEASTDVPAALMARAKAGDWTKPAAMAIPKEGYFQLEQGRYGPIYPKTPANYGFTIIAKIKPGREEKVRSYGNHRERRRWRSVRSCSAAASLPEMGSLQHRQ
jgi:hypothetical protein